MDGKWLGISTDSQDFEHLLIQPASRNSKHFTRLNSDHVARIPGRKHTFIAEALQFDLYFEILAGYLLATYTFIPTGQAVFFHTSITVAWQMIEEGYCKYRITINTCNKASQ